MYTLLLHMMDIQMSLSEQLSMLPIKTTIRLSSEQIYRAGGQYVWVATSEMDTQLQPTLCTVAISKYIYKVAISTLSSHRSALNIFFKLQILLTQFKTQHYLIVILVTIKCKVVMNSIVRFAYHPHN